MLNRLHIPDTKIISSDFVVSGKQETIITTMKTEQN